jgi:hypothetical protein
MTALDVDPRTLAHSDGPATAQQAAAANSAGKARHREVVLAAYIAAGRPCSTAEISDLGVPGMDLTEVRRRSTDLLNLGMLERTEETDGRARPGHRLAVTARGIEATS